MRKNETSQREEDDSLFEGSLVRQRHFSFCRRTASSAQEPGRGATSVEQYRAMRDEMEELLVTRQTEVLRLKDALGSTDQSLLSADARIRSLQSASQVPKLSSSAPVARSAFQDPRLLTDAESPTWSDLLCRV